MLGLPEEDPRSLVLKQSTHLSNYLRSVNPTALLAAAAAAAIVVLLVVVMVGVK